MKGLDVYVDKKEDDYKIEKAKLDQDLAERIAKGRLALKEAEFDAESNVPSDADVIPGDAEDQSSKPKSLMGSYQAEAKRRLDELRAGLEGEHLERFNSSMELYDQDSALRIRRTSMQPERAWSELSNSTSRWRAIRPVTSISWSTTGWTT